MSRESIVLWAEHIANRNPRPFYVTGPTRFGPDGYDCSGFTYMAYLSDQKVIPADSSLVARWGRTNGQVHPVGAARLADLVVHDKYGDPYNSSGPRGHIGLVDHVAGNRVITWESSGTGHGVAPQNRPIDFWAISVQHPAFAGTAPTPTTPEGDMANTIPTFKLQGDQSTAVWFTDLQTKWWCENTDSAKRIAAQGLLYRPDPKKDTITWPQVDVDQIPAVGKVPSGYSGNRA